MEKSFNVAGPCFPDEHYMLPALDRAPGMRRFVEQRLYFVLHAPRQSGKTTAMKALVREINGKGAMNALTQLGAAAHSMRMADGGPAVYPWLAERSLSSFAPLIWEPGRPPEARIGRWDA